MRIKTNILRAVFINIVVVYTIIRNYETDETAVLLALSLLPLSILLLKKRIDDD